MEDYLNFKVKVRRKISAHVDGGLSGGSCVRGPGSEDPHRREWKFMYLTHAKHVLSQPNQTRKIYMGL
jgi:hypothetical protein